MARKKEYIEAEVLDKALSLFWTNGYEATSTRMLEKQMGINPFSIYASFGSKQGLFLACLKLYTQKISLIADALENSKQPIDPIKQYFYDFISFSKNEGTQKGCFITNAANEFGMTDANKISTEATNFTNHIRDLFLNNLMLDKNKPLEVAEKQADYLIISISGLSVVSKLFPKRLLDIYIENTFLNI